MKGPSPILLPIYFLFLALMVFYSFPSQASDSDMEGLIEQLAGDRRCEQTSDCRVIGVGSKECGGPRRYLIYSLPAPAENELKAKVAALNELDRELHEELGTVSDCTVVEPPIVACVDGYCVEDTKSGL